MAPLCDAPAPPSRVAIVTCVAYRPVRQLSQSQNHSRYTGDAARLRNYVANAVTLGASLDAVGSRVPRIAITAFLQASQRSSLLHAGWCVRDFTPRRADSESAPHSSRSLGIDMLPYYRPLYTREQAIAEGRPWLQPTQQRTDGAATYYKLLAWTLTCYSRVLMVDADVVFKQNPDAFITNGHAPYFAAVPKVADRAYTGFNSHVMCLTPDRHIFRQLLAKAASGQYFVYTNGEQDVLETVFTAESEPNFPADSHYHMRSIPHLKMRVNGTSSAEDRSVSCMMDEGVDRSLLPRRARMVHAPVVVECSGGCGPRPLSQT